MYLLCGCCGGELFHRIICEELLSIYVWDMSRELSVSLVFRVLCLSSSVCIGPESKHLIICRGGESSEGSGE